MCQTGLLPYFDLRSFALALGFVVASRISAFWTDFERETADLGVSVTDLGLGSGSLRRELNMMRSSVSRCDGVIEVDPPGTVWWFLAPTTSDAVGGATHSMLLDLFRFEVVDSSKLSSSLDESSSMRDLLFLARADLGATIDVIFVAKSFCRPATVF